VVGIENPSSPLPCGDPAEPDCTPFSFSESETKTGTWMWGWTVGIGFDYLIMPNVFLRAEYEYVYFAQVAGIKPTISNGRIGVGLKF
jgi:opacity protein-like surface antigen